MSESPRQPGGWQAAARLLGLGARARTVVAGVQGVKESASRGRLELVVVAADASRHSAQKIASALRQSGVTLLIGPEAAELGASVGRSPVVAIGVLDRQLAAGISRALSVERD